MERDGGRRRLRAGKREVQEVAVALRRALTPAEERLWRALRDRRLTGLKWRRQHALDRFVLDFFCAEARLCVEVDGAVHDAEPQRERDEARSAALNARGIRVLRVRNEEVLANLRSVLRRITAAATEP